MIPFLLAAWFLGISIPMIYFHAFHNTPLPKETPKQSNLKAFVKSLDSNKTWTNIHFITDQCLCSNELAKYLVERKAQKDISELVIIVGKSSVFEKKIKTAGYETKHISEKDLAQKIGITGIPLYVILDQNQQLKYYGGYSERVINKTTVFKDLEILKETKKGKSVTSLPKFGCAVSSDLQARLDPFNLKYGDWNHE